MSSDIYQRQNYSAPSRKKRLATSQRRDEYLRAIGEKPVHHYHRKHHHRTRRWKIPLFSLGLLVLLIAGSIWWLTLEQ